MSSPTKSTDQRMLPENGVADNLEYPCVDVRREQRSDEVRRVTRVFLLNSRKFFKVCDESFERAFLRGHICVNYSSTGTAKLNFVFPRSTISAFSLIQYRPFWSSRLIGSYPHFG